MQQEEVKHAKLERATALCSDAKDTLNIPQTRSQECPTRAQRQRQEETSNEVGAYSVNEVLLVVISPLLFVCNPSRAEEWLEWTGGWLKSERCLGPRGGICVSSFFLTAFLLRVVLGRQRKASPAHERHRYGV